jgi:hypothetical protein
MNYIYILFYIFCGLIILLMGKALGYRLSIKEYSKAESKQIVWKFNFRFILILTFLSLLAWGYREEWFGQMFLHFLCKSFELCLSVEEIAHWNTVLVGVLFILIAVIFGWVMKKMNQFF